MRKLLSLLTVGAFLTLGATAGNAEEPIRAGSSSSVSTWKLDMARPLSKSITCPGIKIPITYELVPGFGPGKQVTVQWYDSGKKGKNVSCLTLAYANHATGSTSVSALVPPL